MKSFLLTSICLLFCILRLTAQNPPPREENSLRLMSYNIRNCVGTDGVTDYDRVADIIRRSTPDVVALQELDSMTTRHPVHVLGKLAERTLMHATYAPAVKIGKGRYGIGLLSKEKPINVRRIPLPGVEEKRMLLVAEFEKYVVLCTHFSLTARDRLISAGIIFDAVRDIEKPVFLAGDMNDTNDSETQRLLTRRFTVLNNPERPTFGSGDMTKCIDYIYCKSNGTLWSVLGRGVIDDEVASDHRPVWVDVRIAAAESDIFRTKPYLQNPAGGGVTVTWLTNVPVHSWVEYSSDRQNWHKAQTIVDGQVVSNNKIHKIRLDGLEPGVRYHYRAVSREITLYGAYRKEFGRTVVSEEYSFRLPAPDQRDFTALVFNDLHNGTALLDTLMLAVKGVEYDFVLLNGDILSDPRNEADAVDYISFVSEKVDAARHPMILLRGNHEIRNAWSVELKKLLDYPGGRTYGAFSWGDTRFVMLDCGEDKPDSHEVYYGLNDFEQLRLDQIGFLREELASDAFLTADKKVLIHHIPVYGMNGDENGWFNPCLDLWHPLLKEALFDVGIHGHTHRPAYHPAGSADNSFPVVIGGGSSMKGGTVMILSRKRDKLRLRMLSTAGETMYDLVY